MLRQLAILGLPTLRVCGDTQKRTRGELHKNNLMRFDPIQQGCDILHFIIINVIVNWHVLHNSVACPFSRPQLSVQKLTDHCSGIIDSDANISLALTTINNAISGVIKDISLLRPQKINKAAIQNNTSFPIRKKVLVWIFIFRILAVYSVLQSILESINLSISSISFSFSSSESFILITKPYPNHQNEALYRSLRPSFPCRCQCRSHRTKVCSFRCHGC